MDFSGDSKTPFNSQILWTHNNNIKIIAYVIIYNT